MPVGRMWSVKQMILLLNETNVMQSVKNVKSSQISRKFINKNLSPSHTALYY